MQTYDVTIMLDLTLHASGRGQATVLHKPCLLSDNGFRYISGELAEWLEVQKMGHVRGPQYHPQSQGKRGLAADAREPHPVGNYYLPGDLKQ